jgi:hypothetical protein
MRKFESRSVVLDASEFLPFCEIVVKLSELRIDQALITVGLCSIVITIFLVQTLTLIFSKQYLSCHMTNHISAMQNASAMKFAEKFIQKTQLSHEVLTFF